MASRESVRIDQARGVSQDSLMSSEPLVVALIYSQNGMATWCWEVAHALHEVGRKVILIVAEGVALPGKAEVEVHRIAIEPAQYRKARLILKVASKLKNSFSARPDGVLKMIETRLAKVGIQPAAYLLNQSSLVDPDVHRVQLVAAWAYPVDLMSYMRKVPLLVSESTAEAFLRTGLSSVSWWLSDWRGYRASDRVLSVTEALTSSLRDRSVAAELARPGTSVVPMRERDGNSIVLLMAAVRLNEPRKRIHWMLDAMKHLIPPSGTVLKLAGEPDDTILSAAARLQFQVEFLGHLNRDELQQVMHSSHVFCFGSVLDDWGYVLVEAMSCGLVPIAPALSPFNEILGDVGACYRPYDKQDFANVVDSSVNGPLLDKGAAAWHRASTHFSRLTFGNSLLDSLRSVKLGMKA